MYSRNCPECNKELNYKNKRKYENANKVQSLCSSCSKKGERNPCYGIKGESHPRFGKVGLPGDLNPSKRIEVREKISKSKKGMSNGREGYEMPDEIKLKIKNSNTGKKHNISDDGLIKMKEARQKQIGEKCPGWKNGKTNKVRRLRNSDEYKEWRNKVFERDDHICKHCLDDNKKELNAHHIITVSESLEKMFLVENGITLCKECHLIFHKKYGKISNKEDVDEFLKSKFNI